MAERGMSMCAHWSGQSWELHGTRYVRVCSEISRLQLHHRAAFILKVETEGKRKEGKIDGRQPGNYAVAFHSYDSGSLSQVGS